MKSGAAVEWPLPLHNHRTQHKGKKMIEIKTEKVVIRGEQRRKIISVFALTEKELPQEYTKEGERVFLETNCNTRYLRIEHTYDNVYEGGTYPEHTFNKFLDIIRKAGDRLRDINKKLAEANKDWHGEETFLI